MQDIQPLPDDLKKTLEQEVSEKQYFPILKPGDWVGIKHGAVHSELIGTDDQPEVVIGFGYDTPDNFVFLTGNNQGIDIDDAVKLAYDNLHAMDVTFTPVEALENRVLTASGSFFSSEAILSKKHMQAAHDMLNAEQLLISIARRTVLTVADRAASDEVITKFIHLHNYTWDDDSFDNAPITNMLFVVEGGEIVGVIPMEQ